MKTEWGAHGRIAGGVGREGLCGRPRKWMPTGPRGRKNRSFSLSYFSFFNCSLAIRNLDSVPTTSLKLMSANPMELSSTFILLNTLQEVTVVASPVFMKSSFPWTSSAQNCLGPPASSLPPLSHLQHFVLLPTCPQTSCGPGFPYSRP